MSIEFVHKKGPDAGLRYTIRTGRSIEIGPSARANICLKDTSIQGHLKISCLADSFQVTNYLKHSVYLGKTPLAKNESRVWFLDTILQPSEATLILLTVSDTVVDWKPDESFRILSGNEGLHHYWKSGIVAVGLVAGLFIMASATPAVTPSADLTDLGLHLQSTEVLRSIDRLALKLKDSEQTVLLNRLSERFAQARLADVRGDEEAAAVHYSNANDILKQLITEQSWQENAAETQPLTENISRIVNQRLIELRD